MIIPNSFYVIYQPTYQIPSVLDLHKRGQFKMRPFVSKDSAHRIIASDQLEVKLQYIQLIERNVVDPETGERYSFVVEDVLIDLDENLSLDPGDLLQHVSDETICNDIMMTHQEWCNAYIPPSRDKEALKKKLLTSITERKEIMRRELVDKNSKWVNAAMPRLIWDFQYGLYLRVEDRLYVEYRQRGGEESEKDLVRKIMLFYRIYEGDNRDLMLKPNGEKWKDEQEIWECWIGFAGSEDEAKRVCQTMEVVFRPLQSEI